MLSSYRFLRGLGQAITARGWVQIAEELEASGISRDDAFYIAQDIVAGVPKDQAIHEHFFPNIPYKPLPEEMREDVIPIPLVPLDQTPERKFPIIPVAIGTAIIAGIAMIMGGS